MINHLKNFFEQRYREKDINSIYYVDNGSIKFISNQELLRLIYIFHQKFLGTAKTILLEGNKHPYTIAAIIACLTLNKAFVALKPTLSEADKIHILSQLDSFLFYTAKELESTVKDSNISEIESFYCSFTESFAKSGNCSSSHNEDISYYIFTSGSTGAPKGVQIYRSSFSLYISYLSNHLKLKPGQLQLSLSPIFFDNFIFDLAIFLFSNKPILLVDALEFVNFISQPDPDLSYIENIDFIYAAPSIIDRLLNSSIFEYIHSHSRPIFVGFGGEPFSWQSSEKLLNKLNRLSRVINFYGPSECTCMCSSFELCMDNFDEQRTFHESFSANLPIGKLFDYFQYELLDNETSQILEHKKNTAGELLLSGPCLMKGYIDSNIKPFVNIDSTHFYKTGDIVTSYDYKSFYIHGRTDNQFKILGNRVELEEIESKLKSLLHENDLLVSILHDRGIPRIILLILEKSIESAHEFAVDPNEAVKISFINSKMSGSMRVSDIFNVANILLTPNGKLDRKYYQKKLKDFLNLD